MVVARFVTHACFGGVVEDAELDDEYTCKVADAACFLPIFQNAHAS